MRAGLCGAQEGVEASAAFLSEYGLTKGDLMDVLCSFTLDKQGDAEKKRINATTKAALTRKTNSSGRVSQAVAAQDPDALVKQKRGTGRPAARRGASKRRAAKGRGRKKQ